MEQYCTNSDKFQYKGNKGLTKKEYHWPIREKKTGLNKILLRELLLT
jgi:hypothetical protein